MNIGYKQSNPTPQAKSDIQTLNARPFTDEDLCDLANPFQ